jgi:FHS family L-fucose permease-like MFS transporter
MTTLTPAPSSAPGILSRPDGRSYLVPFALVSSLFLLWGFCNGMIDVMDKHFQEQLHLSLAQSAWVQFAHYLGYFVMALPAGWIASRVGYKGGIIAGLVMVAAGGFWFIPATHIGQFWAFLLGVCFIAAGLTFLETIANPYTTVLGPRQFSATRINLAQSCNGVGWIFGPVAGRMFFYSADAQGRSTGAQTLWIPYAAVGVIVLVLCILFAMADLPDLTAEDGSPQDGAVGAEEAERSAPPARRAGLTLALLWLNLAAIAVAIGMIAAAFSTMHDLNETRGAKILAAVALAVIVVGSPVLWARSSKLAPASVWNRPHFSAATLAQFFYVAAQSGIFAYFINYMTTQTPAAITDQNAALLASVAFGCFLAGRVVGSWLLKNLPAARLLGVYGALNVLLCAVVMLKLGWVSVAAVFASYFFMSIMFPTIFALGIHGLGSRAKRASGFIVMAIMGGAIVPKLMGRVAEHWDLSFSFVVPLFCFVVVAIYGFGWPHLAEADEIRPAGP